MFNLAESLKNYEAFNAMEKTHVLHTRHLLKTVDRCFWRDQFNPGHLCGSACITTPDYKRILMIMHPVIKQWIQPGGHSDGDQNTLAVALKETEEEVGFTESQLGLWNNGAIFDVDTHYYPAVAKKNEPEHIHFDIRFLFTHPQVPVISPEGHETKWFSHAEAEALFPKDGGRYRCLQKLKKLAAS